MHYNIQGNQFLIDNQPIFIQGMNLFLDSFRLEENPRHIYNPPIASTDLIKKIIPSLHEAHINCVRIWPTSLGEKFEASIPSEAFGLLEDAKMGIILNLPVNWNLKPSYHTLSEFLHQYSGENYPNIWMYCIANEVYHGLIMPHQYIRGIELLTHKYGKRATLVTNANLNFPMYSHSDIIGADFFAYQYSISREGVKDVGAVAQMFLEDAEKTYRWFPHVLLKRYYLVVKYLQWKAQKQNFNPEYFRKKLLKVLKVTQKLFKPYLIAEYGYCDDPKLLSVLFNQMPLEYMCGHIWYNWTNFDPNVDGRVENQGLFDEFGKICKRLERLKQKINHR